MNWLQIHLFGPDFSFFSTNSYGYYSSNEPKSDLKRLNFRFSPDSPKGCYHFKIRIHADPQPPVARFPHQHTPDHSPKGYRAPDESLIPLYPCKVLLDKGQLLPPQQ